MLLFGEHVCVASEARVNKYLQRAQHTARQVCLGCQARGDRRDARAAGNLTSHVSTCLELEELPCSWYELLLGGHHGGEHARPTAAMACMDSSATACTSWQ